MIARDSDRHAAIAVERRPRRSDPERAFSVLRVSNEARERRPLILLVDDDTAVRSSLTRLLRADGYEVVTEVSGRGALESVRLLRPDVVLLDVMMTDVDGLIVCRQIRDDPETRLTPVVLLTGLSHVEDRVRGLDAGADDFLTKPPERIELLARVRSLVRLRRYTDDLERAEAVLFSLARSIEAKDRYTEGHCERLATYASRLGRRLGLPDEDLVALRRAGVVHDIGKVAVPDRILLKDGPLDPAEWRIMRQHPVTGEHICGPIRAFRDVLPIIRHHHERFDGSGYPDGLTGIEVPLTARVLQVVDVYDALTTARPYKRAYQPSAALRTMEDEVAKGWWDPDVFAEFQALLQADESISV